MYYVGKMVSLLSDLLLDLDWTKEVLALQKNLALGDAKHRRQVHDLFADIRQGLADCIFCYAAQSGLRKDDTLRLLDYLCKIKPGDANPNAALDNISLTLTLAFLYALDISALNKVMYT